MIKRLIRSPWFLAIFVLILAIGIAWNIPIEKRKYGLLQGGLMTDYTGLLPERIERIEQTGDRYDLQRIIKEANQNNSHLSIAGLQHSQGGHTYYKDGIVLDMKSFNRILEIDQEAKTVKVESGATWEDVQEALNPLGLALKVTQSQSIFTIGGSLSVNGHGRDITFGSMANSVKEMTLLTPTGEIKHLTKKDPENWMNYVLGGYGLFGVILDVTLEVTDNNIYKIKSEKISTNEYESYFNQILENKKIDMHYARINVAPGSFLDEMYVVNYEDTGQTDRDTPLKGETGIKISKMALDLARKGGKMEDFFWNTQGVYMNSLNGKEITRNNVMRSESTFMEFTKPGRVEILQEFFIPIQQYEEYMDELKTLLNPNDQDEDFKVHNITVRYAKKDSVTTLPFAKENMLGLVVLIQHGLDEKEILHAERMIQKWTNITLKYDGTYYLPYYPYQTMEQFQKAYPESDIFRKEKQKRDPNEVFVNLFYDHYLKRADDDHE